MARRSGWRTLLTQALGLFHTIADAFFDAFAGGVVVGAIAQIFREAFHVGDAAFDVVRVLVVLAVVEVLHEAGGRVAQVQRDGLGGGVFDIAQDGAVGGVEGVRLGREGEIDDGLREREIAFGRAEEIDGVAGGQQRCRALGAARPMSSTAMRTTRRAM